MTINSEMTAAFVYSPGQAPFELITNDVLKNTLKPMLGVPVYGALARVSKTFQKRIEPLLDVEWNKILKTITFGKDKWLNIPGVVSVSDEPTFTEEQLKSLTSKFKGNCQIFNEPDPVQAHRFQNDKIKKTWATHMLIFFPESINGNPRTLNVIGPLFRFERAGCSSTVFGRMPPNDELHQSPSGSYWRVVPRDIFPGSRGHGLLENKVTDIIKNKGYMIPLPMDAATAVLIMNLDIRLGNGEYFFSGGSERKYSTFIATKGDSHCWRVIVGGASFSGLNVLTSSGGGLDVGVAGFMEIL
jgi:hypothetical protein